MARHGKSPDLTQETMFVNAINGCKCMITASADAGRLHHSCMPAPLPFLRHVNKRPHSFELVGTKEHELSLVRQPLPAFGSRSLIAAPARPSRGRRKVSLKTGRPLLPIQKNGAIRYR